MKQVNILNINQFKKQSTLQGFYANTLEDHLTTAHKDIALPHSHNFYLAILFTHGKGIHEIDFTTYEVTPGSLFFLNPGQTHHWELSADVKGFVFFHTQDFYDLYYTQNRISQFPFFYSMHSKPCLYLTDKEAAEITYLFEQVYYMNEENGILKKEKVMSFINLVYACSTGIYANGNIPAEKNINSTYYNKFRKLEELVEQKYKTEKRPAAYAQMLNISPKHLNRITQAVAQKTTGDIITERLLLEAKKELVLQQKNFNEIAYSLGFDDYAYFSRLFKKKTGATPSAFLIKYKKG
jgi:AraC-like DNA-binding protein